MFGVVDKKSSWLLAAGNWLLAVFYKREI